MGLISGLLSDAHGHGEADHASGPTHDQVVSPV